MGNVIYLKNKQKLRVEYVERLEDAVEDGYTLLTETYLCGEGKGWVYYINLADNDLAYWRNCENGSCSVDYIELIEFSNTGKPRIFANKIYLDEELIFDMEDYEIKTYLYYDKEDDEYFKSNYLCPKEGINLPERATLDIDKLKKEGGIFDKNAIFEKLKEVADKEYGGHFTLMKFTTNWRCSFGTVNDFMDIQGMYCGKTEEEAMINALENK